MSIEYTITVFSDPVGQTGLLERILEFNSQNTNDFVLRVPSNTTILFTQTLEVGNSINKLTVLGESNVVFDGNNQFYHFGYEFTVGNLEVNNISFVRGQNNINNAGSIVAIRGGSFRFTNCNFNSNQGVNGGAIQVDNSLGGSAERANLTILDCRFELNRSSGSGGAIYHNNGNLVLRGSRFESNEGGNVVFTNRFTPNPGTVRVENCQFTNSSGGGIFSDGSSISIENSQFTGTSGGRALSSSSTESLISVRNSRFESNTATFSGAGIFTPGSLEVFDSHFESNVSSGGGGAINCNQLFRAERCTFINNQATTGGNAISIGYNSVLQGELPFRPEIHDCTISGVGGISLPNVSGDQFDLVLANNNLTSTSTTIPVIENYNPLANLTLVSKGNVVVSKPSPSLQEVFLTEGDTFTVPV